MFNSRLERFFAIRLAVVACLLATVGCDDSVTKTGAVVSVGIYAGTGAWSHSAVAVGAALDDAGYDWELVTEQGILGDSLDRYEVVVLPGGLARDMVSGLGMVGLQRLNHHVRLGGGLIGLGQGAVIVDSDTLGELAAGIYPGKAIWAVNEIAPWPEQAMTDLQLVERGNSLGWSHNVRLWSLYRWGPHFVSANLYETEVVYNYAATGTPAVIIFTYGQGRVFLSGCQLENEENSDRDGTGYGSELYDPDSEWDLLIRGVQYCLWERI